MDCTKCGHPQRQHYVTKDESITGCFLCVCHAYVGERPKRGSIVPDIKKEVPDMSGTTWSLELNRDYIDASDTIFGDQAPVTIIDGDSPEVIIKED